MLVNTGNYQQSKLLFPFSVSFTVGKQCIIPAEQLSYLCFNNNVSAADVMCYFNIMGITSIDAIEAVTSVRSERPIIIIKVYRVWSHPPIKGGIEWETAQPGKQKPFAVKGKTVRSRKGSRVGENYSPSRQGVTMFVATRQQFQLAIEP
jgi:hypothetical protein